eukprot:TRINITY_DN1115_c0_g1_i3.p1 TRINITY_DN1115_c0_g1~~TRINITY_DN1115_c0_g1_i3.p1  ORF type:complete len:275 (+),score=36.98 TRINITY_DN1115_c0_g1_i3:209-1033(+)
MVDHVITPDTKLDRPALSETLPILVVGRQGAGKTCLVKRFHQDTFDEHEPPTIVKTNHVDHPVTDSGFLELTSQELSKLTDRGGVLLKIVDLSGARVVSGSQKREYFKEIRQDGVMLVIDVTEPWDVVEKELTMWKRRYIESEAPEATILIAANKSNEGQGDRGSSYGQISRWVNKWNEQRYQARHNSGLPQLPEVVVLLTSAKSGTGVSSAFYKLSSTLLKRRLEHVAVSRGPDDPAEPKSEVEVEMDEEFPVAPKKDKADKDAGCACKCVVS